METMKIELINPNARKLLLDLVELKLIKIAKPTFSRQKFFDLLADLRSDDAPSLEEIQKEVKIVRQMMGERK